MSCRHSLFCSRFSQDRPCTDRERVAVCRRPCRLDTVECRHGYRWTTNWTIEYNFGGSRDRMGWEYATRTDRFEKAGRKQRCMASRWQWAWQYALGSRNRSLCVARPPSLTHCQQELMWRLLLPLIAAGRWRSGTTSTGGGAGCG